MVLRELHLFAGAGGGILGGILCGHRPVCAVEIDPYARSVLLQRQRDGILPWFPIWDDVRTFDGHPWAGLVDVVCGGFPCQDISIAGKGAGIDGERSGLWGEMFRVICEVRPRFAFVENSPALTGRGLGRVLGDLAEMGYDCRWGCVSAEDAIWLGGPPALDHIRERIWILATDANAKFSKSGKRHYASMLWRRSQEAEQAGMGCCENAEAGSNTDSQRLEIREGEPGNNGTKFTPSVGADWWLAEPKLGRVADGVAHRVDRLKAIGNGQVPAVAALAWHILSSPLPLTTDHFHPKKQPATDGNRSRA